jgi:DNA-binding NarL/FixJ family response regulator
MRVYLADDQTNVRFALRTLLSGQPGIDVVGEALDGRALLQGVSAAQPDLVLLDWGLPGVPTQELIAGMRTACPGLTVIVLSGRLEVRSAARAAGADCFISKADPPGDLLAAVMSLGDRRQPN